MKYKNQKIHHKSLKRTGRKKIRNLNRNALVRTKKWRSWRAGKRDGYKAGYNAGYNAGWAMGYRDARWNAISLGICKPKVGYVIPSCTIAGGIAVVLQHANRLLNRGYDVTLISMDGNTHIDWHPNQVPIISAAHAQADLDIVIATFWATMDTAREFPAIKRFYFIQSDESKFYPADSELSRKAYQTYEANDFTFLTMARWLQRWLSETFHKQAIYIPNGLDTELMHQSEPLESKGDKVRVLLEGAISVPYKGQSEAFEAVRNLDCEVWCVSSDGKPDISWRCDRFFEKVSYDQMKYIYSSCDILLKMSKIDSFLYPPLEMMSCGGVPIVAEVTGTDEYLIDQYNSLIIPNEIEAASNAVQLLIENPLLREQLRAGGQATFPQWEWESSIDLLEKALVDIS